MEALCICIFICLCFNMKENITIMLEVGTYLNHIFAKTTAKEVNTATMGTTISVQQTPVSVCSVISPSLVKTIRRGNTLRAGAPNTRKHHKRPQNEALYKIYLVLYLLVFNSSTISLHRSSIFKCNDTL